MKGLVKLAPIVIIVACAASLFFAFKVSGIKKGLLETKAQLEGDLKATGDKLAKTQGELSDTQTKLTESQNEGLALKAKLGAAEVELAQKKREAEDLVNAKKDVEAQLATANTKLGEAEAALKPLQTQLDELKALNVEDLTKQVEAITAEKKVLEDKVKSLGDEKQQLAKEIESLKFTPSDTRGHVALAKDQWNFVVLDIGKEDKVRENTDFLLYRDAKLIAKARVTTVNQNNSVAELLPEFSQGAPKAGDMAVIAAAKPM